MVPPRWPDEQGRLLPTRPCQMQAACYSGNQMPLSRGLAVRWVLAALTTALIVWLFAACAAGRPTSLIRLRAGYEVLTAHCEARPPESCTPVHVTGDPHDEEAWGFRARPAADALWREPEVLYAVGDRGRCDEVRVALGTPTEACWGPVYFRRR